MSAPTPGDVFGPRPGADPRRRFFDVTGGPVARRRARALNAANRALEDLLAATRALHHERHLDLNVERYRRDVERLDDALQELDDALADPDGPPPPRPTARH